MHRLNEALLVNPPKSRGLQEWEYRDIFDQTCTEHFKGDGIKVVDGKIVLIGLDLRHEEHSQLGMGVFQMSAEKWEKRMGEMCRTIVHEWIGEDRIYKHFGATGKLAQSLCHKSTRVCQKGAQNQKRDKNPEKMQPSKSNGIPITKKKKTKSKQKQRDKSPEMMKHSKSDRKTI